MFKNKNESTKIRKEDIMYFIELAKTLALPYGDQYKLLDFLDDYITHDIASDWIWQNIGPGVMKMFDQNLITNNEVELYKKIDKNFYDVSLDGAFYNEEFWSLNGLKNHPLWKEQRSLAKTILNTLEKIVK